MQQGQVFVCPPSLIFLSFIKDFERATFYGFFKIFSLHS